MSAIAVRRRAAVTNVPEVHTPVSGSWVAPSERGEDLVPRAKQGEVAFHLPAVFRAGAHVVTQRTICHLCMDLGREPCLKTCLSGTGGVPQRGDRVGEWPGLGGRAVDLLDRTLQNKRALDKHELGVHIGGNLDGRVVRPGAIGIRPALYPVGPGPGPVRTDGGRPVVEPRVDQRHRHVSFAAVGVGQDHRRVDRVVPLTEDRCGHVERLAHN